MNYVAIRRFLPPDADAAVRALARDEARFVPATVTGDASWRAGRVAHVEGRPEARAVAEAVLRAVPFVAYQLRVDAFAPSRCEVQLSSYGDGDYFRAHADDGSPDTAARVLSWVIYLDLVKPRAWYGGNLCLADDVRFRPEDGTVIFFPSSMIHEVTPVAMDEGDGRWEARRFTVNGWVRR